MQRDDPEPVRAGEEAVGDALARKRGGRRHRSLAVEQQRVDHHVADEADARRRDSLAHEIVRGRALGDEEKIGDLIGQHAIDLFGHLAVEAAQPRLHVSDGRVLLGRDQAARERRVDVADDDHQARQQTVEHGLEAAHDLGRLHRVRPRADLEVEVGRRHFEIGEQPLVHCDVVVLAGMDENDIRQVRTPAERADERRHLHVIRSCANDAQERSGRSQRVVHFFLGAGPGLAVAALSGCRR